MNAANFADKRPASLDELTEAFRAPCGSVSPSSVSLRETNLSQVFVTGDRAYKLKKPVRLPFLDYSTPDRRREMCSEEVRLNRRLAPAIYLGVRALVRHQDGIRLEDVRDERAFDYVVEMRRFRDESTLAEVLKRGEDDRIGEVARLLQRFHAQAEECRPVDVVAEWRSTLDENLRTLSEIAPGRRMELEAHRRFDASYIDRRGGLLDRRAAEGKVRDGHGDLRADHVLLESEISIVDCVEFNSMLRRIDTSADVAYLVVDLRRRGWARQAQKLITAYRAAGGDAGDESLLSFFCAYRALVTAKVAVLRGAGETDVHVDRLFSLARRYMWNARLPLALVVCGVSASGKSLLADAIANESGLPVLSSDRIRKELVGIAATDRAPVRAYSREMTLRTYSELGRRATTAIRDAGGVIVDATFHRGEQRQAFLHAYAGPIAPVFMQCKAPEGVLRRRVAHRSALPARTSDATVAVLERQLAEAEPFPSVLNAFVVSTDATPEQVVRRAVRELDRHIGPSAGASVQE